MLLRVCMGALSCAHPWSHLLMCLTCFFFASSHYLVSLCLFHLSSDSKNNLLPSPLLLLLLLLLRVHLPWEPPLCCREQKDTVSTHIPFLCMSWSSDSQRSNSLCWLHQSAHSIELIKRSLWSIHWSARLYFTVWAGHLSFSRADRSNQEQAGKISLQLFFPLLPPSLSASSLPFFGPLTSSKPPHLIFLSPFLSYSSKSAADTEHTHKFNFLICICSAVV